MFNGENFTSRLVDRVALLLVISWTLIIVVVGLLHAYGNRKMAISSALIEARTLAKQEELNRVWLADKGGIYESLAAGESDKRLSVLGLDAGANEMGARFGLVSHFDITRQMYRRLEEEYGYRARMVRADSPRPQGIPDAWETKGLRILATGEDSFYEIFPSGRGEVLRYIAAARSNETCVTCHPGIFRPGELFGGFSLTVPLDPFFSALGNYSYSVLVGYLLIWSIGLILTQLAVKLFKSQLVVAQKRESQLQIVETNLHYISYFDPNTNLPNRATFNDRLKVAMAHAGRLDERIAVAVVNIENFNQIRDLFSRGIGDQLIRVVAETVSRRIRPDDTIARMGNDRLLLLLPGLVSRENVARIINNINEAFESPIVLDDTEIQVRISFGVAVFPDDGEDPMLLITYAETAASRVSRQRSSNLQMYSAALNEAAHAHLQLETGLRQGLNRNEFCVYYQPQVDAPSGQVTGAEALIRWNHPELGLIRPDTFIPMAENNGAIVPIGEWVMLDACRQAVAWQQQFNVPFRIGINVSARQFQDAGLIDAIDRAISDSGISPDSLEIEVTEGTIMVDVEKAIETLIDLKVRGVKVAIDDFGIGYSSLSQLKLLPFDRLKVDRSFIADLDADRDSQVIVEMIIELAGKLNMEIIAEGVETESQKTFLVSRGCYPMQGYLFSRPMPADAFTQFLEERRSAARLRAAATADGRR